MTGQTHVLVNGDFELKLFSRREINYSNFFKLINITGLFLVE